MDNYYPKTKKVLDYINSLSDKELINSEKIVNDLKMENVHVRKALSTLNKDGYIFRVELGKYIKWSPKYPRVINNIELLKLVIESYFNIKIKVAMTPIEHLNRTGHTKQITAYKEYLYSLDKAGVPAGKINEIIRGISNLEVLFVPLNKPSSIALIVANYFNNADDIYEVGNLIEENFSGEIILSDRIIDGKNAYNLDKLIYNKVSMSRFKEIVSDPKYKNKFVIFSY